MYLSLFLLDFEFHGFLVGYVSIWLYKILGLLATPCILIDDNLLRSSVALQTEDMRRVGAYPQTFTTMELLFIIRYVANHTKCNLQKLLVYSQFSFIKQFCQKVYLPILIN